MNIKLIALDLDGTLLNSKKEISQRNFQVLNRCCQNGIWVVPCTGRSVSGIPQEMIGIPGVRYAITTNGAVIVDMTQKKIIGTCLLPCEQALELLRFVDSYDVMYDPYINGRGITEARFYENLTEYGLSLELQELVRRTRDVHPNILEFVENNGKPVEKINLYFSNMEERAKLRAELEKRADILVTSSLPNNLEINAHGATKGAALLRLASHLGLESGQTMAFGDGENDFSMIQAAGIGVAMKNGREELIAAADYITDTNDEDGVAAAIDKFVLKADL